jgi:hydrophobic/amphiphilic exporter-1 (mainly G- bacteria), HAE1 family
MQQIASEVLSQKDEQRMDRASYQEKLVVNQIYFIFALSLTLVYLVLAALYESWTDPVAVIPVVPTAVIGILTAVALRRFPIDL